MVKTIVDAGQFFGSGTAASRTTATRQSTTWPPDVPPARLAAFAVAGRNPCPRIPFAGFWLAF